MKLITKSQNLPQRHKANKLILKVFLCVLCAFAVGTGKVYADSQPATSNQQPNLPYTVKKITDGNQVDFHPDFSPDGKEIVFSSKIEKSKNDKKFWERSPYYLNLWTMDSEGKNRRQLTSGNVMDFFPSFTPDGKKVLFVSNRENGQWDIWSINRDGSGLTRITNNRDKDYSPRATPDGKKILFFSTPIESAAGYITESVWIMDMDGGNPQRLTSGGKGDWYPSMSPDGQEILFASMRLVGGSLWSIDREGKNYKRLTYGNVLEFFPHWSPDGTKIAYVSKREDASFDTVASNKDDPLDIWIMDRDGTNKRRLTRNISGGNWSSRFNLRKVIDFISFYHLSWHPDGTKIALTTWEPGQKGSCISIIEFKKDTIDKLPVIETEPIPEYTLIAEEEITSGEWEDFGPSFSPDGNTVVFASDRSGNWDIWGIRVQGSGFKVQSSEFKSEEPVQLTKNSADELAPVFSPDGKKIAFLSQLQPRNSQLATRNYSLWVMTSGGKQARQVTKDIPVLSYPAWSPDGKEIAFVSEGNDEGTGIWTHNLANRTQKKIISLANSQSSIKKNYPFKEFLYRVDYNADGDRIAFESNRSGNVEIWTMDRDGINLTRVTKGDKPHWNPVFSPDGKKIAFTTEKFAYQLGPPFWPAPNYNIWIADTETGKETLLTGEEQTDWNPAWSPDGKKIAYVTNRSGDFMHFSIWMLYLK